MADTLPEKDTPNPGVTLCLAGDVMTGRGIDQILPHPGNPRLYEDFVTDARHYVELAERANGSIASPTAFSYPWGDALKAIERHEPALRLVNLETAITLSSKPAAKAVNYRMHPRNGPVLSLLRIDACGLANNHVLDWRRRGLLETLETLKELGIAHAGAGHDLDEAAAPASLSLGAGRRILFFALASSSSGVPASWAARADRPGLWLFSEFDRGAAARLAEELSEHRKEGDLVVLSIHWGGNWGHYVPPEQIAFAHELIDRGAADLLFTHSSHHPKAIEVHRGKLVLYGCGDLLNDYEGIGGYEQYRGDLTLLYLPTVSLADGRLLDLRLLPLRIRNFRLNQASEGEAAWLMRRLSEEGRHFGTKIVTAGDRELGLSWD